MLPDPAQCMSQVSCEALRPSAALQPWQGVLNTRTALLPWRSTVVRLSHTASAEAAHQHLLAWTIRIYPSRLPAPASLHLLMLDAPPCHCSLLQCLPILSPTVPPC